MSTIPFTEIYERVQVEEMRDESSATATEGKYKGRVNQLYRFDAPRKYDWPFFSKELTAIDLKADYTTGTVTIAASGTAVTGTDTVWTEANSDGFKMKISGYDEIYTFTWTSATVGTISPALTATAADEASYTLFLEKYVLDSDYLRILEHPGVYYYNAGHPVSLDHYSEQQYWEKVSWQPSARPQGFYIPEEYAEETSGAKYMYVTPPPTSAMKLHGKYLYMPGELKEWTAGTVSCDDAGTAVTGSSADFEDILGTAGANLATRDYYLRFDEDGTGSASQWYQVSACADDDGLTLATANINGAKSGDTYTISAAPHWPDYAIDVLVYGACLLTSIEQDNNLQIKSFQQLYGETVGNVNAMYAKTRHTDDRMKIMDYRSGRII